VTTVLLSGHPGSGKTSILRELMAGHAVSVAGVISNPLLDEDDRRTGIEAWLLPGDRRESLAVVAGPPENGRLTRLLAPVDHAAVGLTPGTAQADSILLGPWRFSRAGFDVVNEHLSGIAATAASPSTAPVVVIDEVGPLELARRSGFVTGFEAVMASSLPAVIVVRPSLLNELSSTICDRWNHRSAGIHSVQVSHPAHILPTSRRILAMLGA